MKLILFFFFILSFVYPLENKFIKYEEDKTTGLITISRPNALNALNSQVLEELDKCLDNIDLKKIKVIIITGDGEKAFVAGADISEMSELSKEEGEAFGKKGNELFRKIETFPIPIIAAVNGFALGGGCELALSCDIRICSDNAIFGQPEVGLGITPGFGGTQRLARIIGPGMAKQMIYTGQNIKSHEALRIGLVYAIYQKENLLNEAKKLAEMIAGNGDISVRNAKKAINEGLQVNIEEGMKIEEELFGQCFENEQQTSRMNHFLYIKKYKRLKQGIYPLICASQNYEWGQPANSSLVAEVLRNNGQNVIESLPYAEYWMGTHPNGPSKVIKRGKEILLSDLIGGHLSYLFKILSINTPLSIQLHPDKSHAEALHKQYPKIYKDDNHKPEIFIALSDFELLFGFLPLNEAVKVVETYKNVFDLYEAKKLLKEPNIENYQRFIDKIMFLEKKDFQKIIKQILEDQNTKEDSLVKKLNKYFGLDSGILIALFMNHFHKKKGESFFIDANIPHSYIYGNCLELMSSSDNVIRLGLTHKLVDKENFELIVQEKFNDMIYDEKKVIDFIKVDREKRVTTYDVNYIDDFKLQVYSVNKNNTSIHIEANSTILCLGGNVKINGALCEEYRSLFVVNEIIGANVELLEGSKSAQIYKVFKK